MTRRKQSALVGLQEFFPHSQFFHLDRGDLNRILEVLNLGPRWLYAEPLIRLMKRLEECGGNLKKMMDGDPELAEAVAKVCVTRWMPLTNRRAHLVLQRVDEEILSRKQTPEQGGPRMRPERYAALLFHVGTLNPEWDKLAGPCARCGRYYLKKRESQKVYCSRRCGNNATAVARTRKRIADERKDKLHRAKTAISEWRSAKTQQDWKHWVSQKTGIDLRFLTRNFTETGGVKSTTKEK
jgi:endogenous inhibitor of DNA gyrase (YacG/DUF329 family)